MNIRGDYAGVGPRETPEVFLQHMHVCGANLARRGWRLRSGGARGADTAFGNGALAEANRVSRSLDDFALILRPKHATDEAIALASKFHPAWHNCDESTRKLMGRNAQIYLGVDLDDPVEFAVTWTPDRYAGGTGMGLRLADAFGIPVFNLNEPDAYRNLIAFSK